ncbi:OmpA family protein (plasmid) [Paracidovorax citrulli]|uniref:OmpA family protein n=1 Tax=Paracidovorax citrulli TaxID=80869 RepID=UPI0006645D07|nr:OmpA family protein [Paracidovorax citrulli]QCX13154.1 Outer membrane protein A [Paracidovorax citrulli]UMT93538.1 OmpA family protein [Paracidovorax citrulli]
MKIKRAISLSGYVLCITVAALHLNGCSSTPKPAEADGSWRVPANEAARVDTLQQRVNADRQLLAENGLLRAQVDALQAKLNEMTSIVREALTLPPAPRQMPTPVPLPPQSKPAFDLPADTYAANPSGVVIRVFHPFAKTDFEPSERVAEALRESIRGADQIEVRGYTDSNVVNKADKLIAIERAEKARNWLVNNGADASKIKTRYFTAGSFLTENTTQEGRGKNRRVEVEIRNQHFAGAGSAVSN